MNKAPFILGIVGSTANKFNSSTEIAARLAIYDLIAKYLPDSICSGGCHLGGIDSWVEEVAKDFGISFAAYLPPKRMWAGGYRERNLKIAHTSSLVAVVVPRNYPASYNGTRYATCYHCKKANPPHIKSAGCWTAWQAQKREWVIV